MKKLLLAVLPLAILASCGKQQERKVLIVANGNISIQGNTINIKDTGNGSSNKIMEIKDPSQTALNLNVAGTKSSVKLAEGSGYYILNLNGKDIYGSLLIDGRDFNTEHDLGLEEQKAMIDSIKLVMAGTNISAANKNYLIKPGQLILINPDVTHTYIYAPFEPIASIDQPADGKPAMLYKFYSKNELSSRLQVLEESYNAVPTF